MQILELFIAGGIVFLIILAIVKTIKTKSVNCNGNCEYCFKNNIYKDDK